MKRKYKNSGFAGEMLVAAELSRLGFHVMFGNVGKHPTERYDLATACQETGHIVGISVKSLKGDVNNAFLIDPEKVARPVRYVFVITGAAGELPQFFVATGEELLANEAQLWGKWGRGYAAASSRGIYPKLLTQYKDNWAALENEATNRE